MKQVRFILSGICLLALLAVGALAQPQEPEKAKRIEESKRQLAADEDEVKKKLAAADEYDVKFRGEMFKVIGPKFGFEMKVIKGAPYSATAETETIQTLADGNHIRNKNTTVVYRDNEGRTRREANVQSGTTMIILSDPVAGVSYGLDTQRRVAVKSQINPGELDLINKKIMAEVEMKKMMANAELKQKVRESEELPVKRPKPVTESLGKQIIEGVECEGTRTTVTIPAGKVGNDLPLDIVSEEWYSPALQVLVLTRQSDPRTGETIYRLTNINRSDPDRTLFEVPADYKIEAAPSMPVKKRKPEEER